MIHDIDQQVRWAQKRQENPNFNRWRLDRINPIDRSVIASVWFDSLQEARESAYMGASDCFYALADDLSNKKIQNLRGTKEAHE